MLIAAASAICSLAIQPLAASAQSTVSTRTLSAPDAVSAVSFGGIESVRALRAGALLVNDPEMRQLVVLDNALRLQRVSLDSASDNGKPYYSSRQNVLLPYLADSTLYFDARRETLLVMDPNGVLVHPFDKTMPGPSLLTMFPPRGFDAAGNAFTTTVPKVNFPALNMSGGGVDRQIVRANFSTQQYEELARLHASFTQTSRGGAVSKGAANTMRIVNPMAPVDEWTVLSDGTLVVLRAKDYSVEMIIGANKQRVSRKIQYEKRRVSDTEKRSMIDSVRASTEGAVSTSNTSADTFASLKDMEDFYPPFRKGQPIADLDGNAWIATHEVSATDSIEIVYHVVNNKAQLIQRVRVPAGRTIVGFARGGIVYLKFKRALNDWVVERTHIVN